MSQLNQFLEDCTVRVGDPEQVFGFGSGFFFSRSSILTAAHVVEGYGAEIPILYKNQEHQASLISLNSKLDLAILEVESVKTNHSALLGTEANHGNNLFVYGYSDENQYGDSVQLKFEGFAKDEKKIGIIKLKSGQIRPGMSGAPILNVENGRVIGLLIQTRDEKSNLGGYGIKCEDIFSFDNSISQANQIYHLEHRNWTNLLPENRQGIGKLNANKHRYHFNVFDSQDAPRVEDLFIEPNYEIIQKKGENDLYHLEKSSFLDDAISILDKQKFLVLAGPYGTGKTICSKFLELELSKRKKTEILFIKTVGILRRSSFEDFVSELNKRIQKSTKQIIVFLDSLEESNRLAKEQESLLDKFCTAAVRFALNNDVRIILNFRNVVRKKARITDEIYENLLVEFNINELTYINLDYFRNEHISNWLDSYFNVKAKGGDERRFLGSEINSLNKNLKNSCSNPLLLYLLCDNFSKTRKPIDKINLFDLYNHFVEFTVNGKFHGASEAIREIRKFYKQFLKEISIEILKEQERIIIKRTDDIDLDESGDILIDPNEEVYAAPYENIRSHIVTLASNYLEEAQLNSLSQLNLAGNIFACYFLEISDERLSFRDNNVLFFFISELLYESLSKALELRKKAYSEYKEVKLSSYYEILQTTKNLQIHPFSLDILFYKIDGLERSDLSLLTDLITDLITNGYVLSVTNKTLESLNSEKINLDIWLSLLYIHTNRISYLDSKLIFFFKRLNWLVSVGKIINKNYQFIVRRFLRNSIIKGAEFRRINCDGYNFDFSRLIDVKFIQVKFHVSRMNYIKFTNASFFQSDFYKTSIDEISGNVHLELCKLDKVYINEPNTCSLSFNRCYIKRLEIRSEKKIKGRDLRVLFQSCDIDSLIIKNQFSTSFIIQNSFYSPINIDSSEISFSKQDCHIKGKQDFKNKNKAIVRRLD